MFRWIALVGILYLAATGRLPTAPFADSLPLTPELLAGTLVALLLLPTLRRHFD